MSDEKKPFNNPFAALQKLRDQLPAPTVPQKKLEQKKAPARAVVRMERAGRKGKEVTVIEQLELSASEREAWLKELKGSLGCGGNVEDGALVVQGDHRERVKSWLEKRGVRKISVG